MIWASWKCIPFQIVDDVLNTSYASLQEILSHTRTKQQFTCFFAKKLQKYLKQKDIDFVIAGNVLTVMSWGEQSSSNHEEADSLIAHIIKLTLEQVMCRDMPLYALASNLFFKLKKCFSFICRICFLTIKHFR